MDNRIEKILQEEPVIHNRIFQIVNDIEPICQGHYLILPKYPAKSISDMDNQDLAEFIRICDELNRHKERIFFERGRSSFCTSFDGPYYGHGHIVPANIFDIKAINTLAIELDAKKFLSLQKAFEYNENNDFDYIIFGTLNGPYYVKQKIPNLKKRFIRKFLTNNLTNEKGALE